MATTVYAPHNHCPIQHDTLYSLAHGFAATSLHKLLSYGLGTARLDVGRLILITRARGCDFKQKYGQFWYWKIDKVLLS